MNPKCPECGSTKLTKHGKTPGKNPKQRYVCNSCGKFSQGGRKN